MGMGEHDDLLHRHQPGLKYDSMEQYFCDSAAEWTGNPGNELRRADGPHALGDLLASGPTLTLDHLGATHYADGKEVRDGDRIGDPGKNYRAQYVALRAARPDLRNRMYGHAVEANGHLWLQYWFFYFYNDYNLALGIGLHEGDWEMIQLRIHDGAPDLAVYAQHRQAEKRPWAQVTKVPGDPNRPMVYVARGSHASYFEPGFHQTEAWYDLADGKRNSPRTTLEIVTDDEPAWIAWPGVWGDTRARVGGIDQPSPQGPLRPRLLDEPRRRPGHCLGAPAQGRDRRARGRHRARPRPHARRLRLHPECVPSHPARGLPAGHGQLARRGGRAAAHLHLPARADPPRHAGHRGPARPRQALRRLREHDERRPADPVGVGAHRARPGGQGRERARRRAPGAATRALRGPLRGQLGAAGTGRRTRSARPRRPTTDGSAPREALGPTPPNARRAGAHAESF